MAWHAWHRWVNRTQRPSPWRRPHRPSLRLPSPHLAQGALLALLFQISHSLEERFTARARTSVERLFANIPTKASAHARMRVDPFIDPGSARALCMQARRPVHFISITALRLERTGRCTQAAPLPRG